MISNLEAEFDSLWESLYPNIDLETEVALIPNRRFRFDYAHPQSRVAIEINGGIWSIGKHSTGKGLMRDYEKLNLAQALGWVVFQLSGDMINAEWLRAIATTIKQRTGNNCSQTNQTRQTIYTQKN